MSKHTSWEELEAQAVQRYRQRLRELHEELGDHAGIVEVEALLVKHENAILHDTLAALTEGISPPQQAKSDS